MIAVCAVSPSIAIAQEYPNVVLSQPLSVRSAGFNGAGAALVGSAGAIFSNPAGIATIRHIGVEGSYRALPHDGSIAAGALAWRLRQFDIGLGLARYKFGTDPVAHPIPVAPTGDKAREFAGLGSLVYRFGIIALAGSGKYVRRVVDDSQTRAFAADAGLAIAIFDIMAIGFSMQNIGGRLGGDQNIEMPRFSRLGIMWNYVDPLETFRLLSTVEMQWPEGKDARLVLGGEGAIVVGELGLHARAAYKTKAAGLPNTRMTYGGSLTISNVAIDYSYQEKGVNGEAAHRFGLRLAL